MAFKETGDESGTPLRKMQGKRMSLAEVIERDCRDMIPTLLKQERRTAKVIALHVGSTPRSVENWRDGFNMPQVPHFIMLARQIPELRRKVLEWLEASTGDNERDPSKVLDEIQKILKARGQ